MKKHKRPAAQMQFGREKKAKGPQYVPLPEAVSDDEVELSDEDMQFVHSHHTDLSFLEKLPTKDLDRAVSQVKAPGAKEAKPALAERAQEAAGGGNHGTAHDKKQNGRDADMGASSDEGEEYERRPRVTLQDAKARKGPKGLPIKTLDGEVLFQRSTAGAGTKADAGVPAPSQLAVAGVIIQDDLAEQLVRERERQEAVEAEERERRASEAAAAAAREEAGMGRAANRGRAGEQAGGVMAELAAYQDAQSRREAAKRSMAAAAQALLADPEGRLGEVKPILELLRDSDPQVRRLAMLTGVAVFKDILPGYRIRPPTDKEAEMVVSKEVKRMRDYEQALLRSYQALLKALLEAAHQAKSGQQPVQHGRIAVKCMATLLTSLPHFNYTSDLLQALVPYMAHRDDQIRELSCGAVAALVRGDAEGGVTVEAVQLVADLVKRRKCVVHPAVLHVLLGLAFSEIGTAEEFEDAKRKRVSKKKKKKGKDEVEKGFDEAQASASVEARRGYQSQTLEALFELLFRVLKTCTASGLIAQRDGPPLPSSRFSKKFPLLFPTLEGLSKYAHLISVDYFGDLMAVLQQLLESSALPPAERLRCLLTVAEILKGQGEAITVDRRSFYTQLYTALIHASLAPLVEEEEEEDEGDQQQQQQAGAGRSVPVPEEQVGCLLSRLLESMILESKLLDVTRQAAFAKRMACMAGAAGDAGAAMGLLCVLHRMMRRQAKLRGMVENESGGPSGYKTYKPDIEDPAEAGALSVPLWELSLLAAHFHPHVAQAARGLAAMATPEGAAGGSMLPLSASPGQLAAEYCTASGGFRPAPTAVQPTQRKKGGKVAAAGVAAAARVDLGAFLTAVQWKAAQDGLLPRLGGAGDGEAACAPPGSAGDDGTLSLPGWGVGDAVAGDDEEQPPGSSGGGAAAIAAVEGGGGAVGPAGVSQALLRHFRLARGFQRNAALRQEAALGRAQVAMFQKHLEEKKAKEAREAEERAKQAPAAKHKGGEGQGSKKKKAKRAAGGA